MIQKITSAIIACCKMEEAYIREWIDWHLNTCKFTHIFLCDNNDTEYKYQLKPLIQDYIDNGMVTVYNYNDIHPIQPNCYNDVYQKHGDEYDWFAIIDIDEFYCLPKYNNDINEFLKTVPEHIYNIGVLWRMYGDNELIEYEDKPVQERFSNYSNKEYFYKGFHSGTKGIIRSKKMFKTKKPVINHHHYMFLLHVKNNSSENKRYDVLFNTIRHNVYAYHNIFNHIDDVDKISNICYIKHYATKTIDEWVKYRYFRGSAISSKESHNYPYKIGKFWKCNEKNKNKTDFINKKYNMNIT